MLTEWALVYLINNRNYVGGTVKIDMASELACATARSQLVTKVENRDSMQYMHCINKKTGEVK